MIEYTKYKSIVVVLIIILFATPYTSAQGLRFYGNKVPIEQRTSYKLFNKENRPVFSDYIDIEFTLRISQSETFGYLFHMMFDFIPIAPVTAVIVAGLLMVLTGCIRSVEAAYKTINWESIVLIAAMLPM